MDDAHSPPPPRELRAALFDFGGVFTDSPFTSAVDYASSTGADPERLLELVFGPYHEDTDHPWHRLERGELSLSASRDEIIALGQAESIDTDPYNVLAAMAGKGASRPQMVERVEQLRARGVATALVTNNVAEFRDAWMGMLPLDDLFDAIVDSSAVGMRKPDPRIYRHALELVGGVAPASAVFLDDYQGNVDAARSLGIHGILVEDDPSSALASLDAIIGAI